MPDTCGAFVVMGGVVCIPGGCIGSGLCYTREMRGALEVNRGAIENSGGLPLSGLEVLGLAEGAGGTRTVPRTPPPPPPAKYIPPSLSATQPEVQPPPCLGGSHSDPTFGP